MTESTPTGGEETSSVPHTVGIGASAGGLEALQQFFAGMPIDSGLCFVVIVHHPPHGPSLLTGILNRCTTMAVETAADGIPLRPNTVCVIPPSGGLTLSSGRFKIDESPRQLGLQHPIDTLFRELATENGNPPIAVILSGTGSDGTEGAKAIKGAGGVVVVQEPASTLHSGMPQSAIDAGVADLVLTIAQMPERIVEIVSRSSFVALQSNWQASLDEHLPAIFAIVKDRAGHDFSSYKTNTIMRRIERRMMVNQTEGLDRYLAFLDANPQESQALAREILIGVTNFFRDPEAFELLGRVVIPEIFSKRNPDDPVRIWHAGCATGEEVYSMAILFQEYLKKHKRATTVQIFATDIDEAAVAQARTGFYPDGIAADVNEMRLQRFFSRSGSGWQVTKQLREMIVFAHHNLIRDPPFSRLDLLVCRNFLIYLNADIQKRLIPLFHQVLKPGGFLFLGSAETVGSHGDLFTSVDKKWKIFARQEGERPVDTLFPFTGPALNLAKVGRAAQPSQPHEMEAVILAEKLLLDRYVPVRVIVNKKHEVVHFSSRTNAYLEMPSGAPSLDLLKMARQELRPTLRAALYKVFTERKEVVFRGIKLDSDGGDTAVNVIVAPLDTKSPAGKLALVIFEPAISPPGVLTQSAAEANSGEETSQDLLVRQLEEQLRLHHEQLLATSEQLETTTEGFMSANEEMMSINEELQSTNEELQSTNEELETSKEELQALNEELVTVNAELHERVEELNTANSDMENLLASSEIATIFLDRRLNIKRFSPAMVAIFHLIPADIGRPFKNLSGKIAWPSFADDAETVLSGRPLIEREEKIVESGQYYLQRVLPYRTKEGKIDGLVAIFFNITERKRAEDALRVSEERFRLMVEGVSDYAIFMLDREGLVMSWNSGAERIKGYRQEEILGRHFSCFYPPEAVAAGLPEQALLIAERDGRFQEEGWRIRKNGSRFWADVIIVATRDDTGRITGFTIITRDLTEQKRAEEEAKAQSENMRARNEALERLNRIMEGREIQMIELKKEVNELRGKAGQPGRYPLDFLKE